MKLENGILVGEAEIVPTPKGKILETLLKSGCKVGVSSRGFGSVKANDDGVSVVQEDYKLVTFDFVADPADSTAYPEVFFEGVEFPTEEVEPNMAKKVDTAINEAYAKPIEVKDDGNIRAHAKEDQATALKWDAILRGESADTPASSATITNAKVVLPDDLLTQLAAMRAEVKEQVRGELLSDPSVAGSSQVLDKIKVLLRPYLLPEDAETVVEQKETEIRRLKKALAEYELQVEGLKDDIEKLGAVAKEAGYKFYLERTLSEDPDAELIRNLIGDVKQFANSDVLKARVDAIREQLQTKRNDEKAIDAKIAAEAERTRTLATEMVEEANAKTAQAEQVAYKLAQANKAMALELYASKQLRNHPRSAKIRSLLESSNVNSREDVDLIVEQFTEADPHDLNEAASWRSRVRKAVGSTGIESDVLAEETPSRQREEDTLHGVPMADIQRMSGIHHRRF